MKLHFLLSLTTHSFLYVKVGSQEGRVGVLVFTSLARQVLVDIFVISASG